MHSAIAPFRRNQNATGQSRIHLLGTMKAIGPDGGDVLPRSRKAQAVLAYLCLLRGERVSRSRLAGMIWDRSPEKQARDSLRHALGELRKTGGTWRIEADHETICLDVSACWIDAAEAPDGADQLLDNLQGISVSFDHWLIGERVRFEQHWQQKLEEGLNAVEGEPPQQRIAAARRLLNFVPSHEAAVRALIAAYLEMGERALAIREFERFRVVVDNTVGVPPSAETVAVYERARRAFATASARGPRPMSPALDGAVPRVGAEPAADGPSVAVLSFQNLSVGRGHDLVAEGLAEDLVEALSYMPGLFVVSRLSAAAFRKQSRTPEEIGAALGVRYLISGSVRVAGDRLRLVIELIEAETGRALWVQRFENRFSDLLDVQNEAAREAVAAIVPRLRAAELKRVRSKRSDDYTAYDFFLRAQESMHHPSRVIFDTAEPLLKSALARAPKYATALAWLAYWHVMRVGQGWSPDPETDGQLARRLAGQAIECDPADPMAFAVQGHVAGYLRKDFEGAFASFEAAIRINPNCARAWLWQSYAHAWLGEGTAAVDSVKRAMALSPYDPLVCAYSGGASMAYFADQQYERAVEFGLRCIRENRAYSAVYKVLIASLVLGGHENEARRRAHQLLLLEPRFTVAGHRRRFPGSAGPLIGQYCEALAIAGVPAAA